MGSWPEATQVGEVGAPPAPGEPRAPFGLEGFGKSGAFSQLEDSKACPPLGTHRRPKQSSQKGPG
jgi:hypothetical protein